VTQYESYLVHCWNHALQQVKAMLRQGVKVVMTSRDYIYRRARNELKEGAFPLLRESQVVIDVHDLTAEERQQMLYNHIKLGRQPREFRAEIKPHLPFIARHRRFIPETARRLGDPLFTKGLDIDRDELDQFVEKQEQLLQEVIVGLDEHSKAALALIYMRNGALESPVVLEESEREAVERLGGNLGGCTVALDCLNGSLVQYAQSEGIATWRFKHPTVGDAFAAMILKNPELLGIYVRGSPMDNLMGQITCGDVGLEHAVALPKSLFPLVLTRLSEFASESSRTPRWMKESRLDRFLTTRCSRDFLTEYIKDHRVLDRVAHPGLLLSASSEVDLAVRLHEFGLLPEQHRKTFVEKVVAYAFEGEDLYAVESRGIQNVFTASELSEFRERIRGELLPRLSDIRWDWQQNWDSNGLPDDHMYPLLGAFAALKIELAGEPDLVRAVEKEITLANDWIAETAAEDRALDRTPRLFGDVDGGEQPRKRSRSIFDDVDE